MRNKRIHGMIFADPSSYSVLYEYEFYASILKTFNKNIVCLGQNHD